MDLFYALSQQRLPDTQDEIRHNKVQLDRETLNSVLFGAFWHSDQTVDRAY